MKPLAIDLFCGLGGWTEGLLAEGWEVIGFDIEEHNYGDGMRYPAQLVLQDVLTIHGKQFKDVSLIVASPPCQEFSYMAMPWSRAKQIAAALRGQGEFPEGYTGSRTLDQLKALFNACFRIQREAIEAAGRFIPLVVENVRGACVWVGRSRWNYGSFHLWGDVPALMPIIAGRQVMKNGIAHRSNGETNFHGHKNNGGSWFNIGSPGQKELGRNPVHEATKVAGLNWSNYGQPGYKPQGFNVTAAKRHREAQEGKKCAGGWFGAGNDCSPMRQHSSKSDSRKAASAAIAKIPLALSQHIARIYKPQEIAA